MPGLFPVSKPVSIAASAYRTQLPTELLAGAFLANLTDQINQIVSNAGNVGTNVELSAARDVNIAVQNATTALGDVLGKKIKDLDQATQQRLAQLQTMVNDITSVTAQTFSDFEASIQQTVNSLPFRGHEPQLKSYSPFSVAPRTSDGDVTLEFNGNFEQAAMRGRTPSLVVGTKTYQPTGLTTQNLKFVVPIRDLTSVRDRLSEIDGLITSLAIPSILPDLDLSPLTVVGSSTNPGAHTDPPIPEPPTVPKANIALFPVRYVSVKLTVPWQRPTGILNLGSRREESNYRVQVGILPSTPGKIVLLRQEVHHGHAFAYRQSEPAFHLGSESQDGNNDQIDKPFALHPDSGWHVVRGTSDFIRLNPRGDWSYRFVSDDGDFVQYNVTTIHHRFGRSGALDFKIRFQETCDTTETSWRTEEIPLAWGESRSLDFAPGTWKIIFDAFDGSRSEFSGVNAQNPYVTLRAEGNSTVISARDPRLVKWP